MPKSEAKRSEFALLSFFFAIKRIRDANWTPWSDITTVLRCQNGKRSEPNRYQRKQYALVTAQNQDTEDHVKSGNAVGWMGKLNGLRKNPDIDGKKNCELIIKKK